MIGKLAKLEGSRKTLERCQHEVQRAKEDVLEAEGNLAGLEQELERGQLEDLHVKLQSRQSTPQQQQQQYEPFAVQPSGRVFVRPVSGCTLATGDGGMGGAGMVSTWPVAQQMVAVQGAGD